MNKAFNQLLQATKNGSLTKAELKQAQIESLDFNWFSRLDKNVTKLEAFGDQIYKKVHDEVTVSNPLELFYDFDQGSLDTEYQLQHVSGGRVYDWAYGTTRKRSPIKMKHWTVLQTPRQLAFEVEVQKLKTGRLLIGELIREAARAILAHKVKTGIDAFVAAYPNAGSYTVNGGGVDITKAVLKSALRPVRGLAEVRAIVGHATAVYPIAELAGYDGSTGYPEGAKDELHRRGMLGFYLGAPLVQLMDYTDPHYLDTPISSSNIWVVPNPEKEFNVFLEYGSTANEAPETNQNNQTVTFYWYWEDGAGLPSDAQLLKYARRIRNCATS